MKDTIQKELAQIEQTQNVRILLAVESGSRAWGLPLRTATMMYGSSRPPERCVFAASKTP